MNKFLQKGLLMSMIAGLSCVTGDMYAQTDPAAQNIPFSFTEIPTSTLPAGIAVHRFGTTTANIPTTRTPNPGVADLPYNNSNANSGGWVNSGASGADGIGMLASGSQNAGAVVIAINTTGKTNIEVSWTARTVFQQASRNNSLALQYRIGDSGSFIDLGTDAHVYTSAGKLAGDAASFSLILPGAAENNALVQLRWIYWESDGTSGSRDRIALDDVSIEETVSGPDVTPPTATVSPGNNAVNVALNASLTLNFSENVVKGAGVITITNTTDNTAQTIDVTTANVTISNAVVTISGVTLANSKSYAVTVPSGTFSDGAGNAFAGITGAADWTFSTIAAPGAPTKIHAIQGSGATALAGDYTIEGVVTRTFFGTNGLNGFYVQEEDADIDVDPATSEGMFVYNIATDLTGVVTPNQGDKVSITGTVTEFVSTTSGVTTSLSQLRSLTAFNNLGAAALPTPVSVQLPVVNVADLERYEGMLVNLSATTGNLVVTEYFQLGRYGQILLSADGEGNQGADARLDQFTQFNAPSTSGYAAHLDQIKKRSILLDDGSTRQNPDPIIFGRGGNPLSASNTLRGGDEVSSITGILDERLEGYRVQTATGVNFQPVNERPATVPDLSSGILGTPTLKVISANVLNYFVNLNTGGNLYRGANSAEEFNRQKAKIVRSLVKSGADVLGVMEIQSNGATPVTALADLVNGLNADPESSGTYEYIDPATSGASISTDAITVGIIYKTDKVTPLGNAATLTTSATFDLVGRRPLAQTFTQNTNGEIFTVVVNHFKSKGSSSGGEGDADILDGQSASNGTRKRQAADLAGWLQTKPTGTDDPDYLILGDLNAYAKEEPISILEAAGYGNLLSPDTYSYVFDGQLGSLDHALATSSLTRQVTSAAKWHINADEPGVLDYNTDFKSAGQINSLYNDDEFRAADHDPVLIGLALDKSLPVTYVSFTGKAQKAVIKLSWETASETDNQGFEILKSENGRTFEKVGFVAGNRTTNVRNVYQFEDVNTQPGQLYYYQLKQIDLDGKSDVSKIIVVRAGLQGDTGAVYPNPTSGKFTVVTGNLLANSLQVLSITGQEVAFVATASESKGAYDIQPKISLKPGLYVVQYHTTDGQQQSRKFVVK